MLLIDLVTDDQRHLATRHENDSFRNVFRQLEKLGLAVSRPGSRAVTLDFAEVT